MRALLFTLSILLLLSAASPVSAAAGSRHPGDQALHLAVPAAAHPGPAFKVDAATRAYLDELPPGRRKASDAYFEGRYWLILWNLIWGLAVAWLLLGTRLSARMRSFATRCTRFRSIHTAVYALLYIVIVSALTFPLTLYQGFFREHAYHLSTQTFPAWFGDQLKGLMLGLVFGTLFLVALFALLRRAPRTWWIWGSIVGVLFTLFIAVIGPNVIEPMFNTFTPLPDGPVKQSILSLARANGVPADNVYVYDESKQSTRISAHVSGMFGTTRVSLNDNLLNRTSPAEIRAVMGHELGHYVLDHSYTLSVFFSIVLFLGFAFVNWSAGAAIRRWGPVWQVHGLSDVAALPVLAAAFSVWFFLMTPVTNTITRTVEAQADIFGLNAAREPDGFAMAALRLSSYRKMSPGPVEEFIFYDHPSGRSRIHMAMQWKAENQGAGTATGAQ
ncbi:MAG: M48 family metallopeptidase [Gammaproteobacteria bacterium]|jgi:STE24 endopeptidase